MRTDQQVLILQIVGSSSPLIRSFLSSFLPLRHCSSSFLVPSFIPSFPPFPFKSLPFPVSFLASLFLPFLKSFFYFLFTSFFLEFLKSLFCSSYPRSFYPPSLLPLFLSILHLLSSPLCFLLL